MNQAGLWKKLLPGFLPIFIFIAVDEIWGTIPGLIVAVSVGCVEMVWISLKEKRFDKFVLFDTLLLVVLGGISILLNNELFFKLKPGLIELILLAILSVSAFSKFDIIGVISRRYLRNINISSEQSLQMRRNMKILFWILLIHTILVFYATFYMSKGAWAFISGGLFYILFGIFFVYQLIKAWIIKKKLAGEEWLPLISDDGNVVGKAPRSAVHKGEKLLHPVVHLHVIDRNKGILLQKRPITKLVQPGKWDTAVGGHITVGENLETALKREVAEEIGMTEFSARLVKVYRWETQIEVELVYMFVTNDHKFSVKHNSEVDELRFWPKFNIEKNLNTSLFTPNFEYDFEILKSEKLI